jgi:hypothetical protein
MARQVTLDHIDSMCSLSFSSIHIALYALILYLCLILLDLGSHLVSIAYLADPSCERYTVRVSAPTLHSFD